MFVSPFTVMDESRPRKRPAARARALRRLSPPVPAPELNVGLVSTDDSLQQSIYAMRAYDSSSSDESIDLEYIESLRRHRFRRSTDTYHNSGDVKTDMTQNHPLDMKGWSSLPDHEYERRWVAEFRMKEPVFRELVKKYVGTSEPRNSNMRTYTAEDKLLVTLNFLAHCPTLRQMGTKWSMPHNSISAISLHPVVTALCKTFTRDANTRNIVWAKEGEAQQAVMEGFKKQFSLPGCMGAIHGSLIPQRKPTKKKANQDSQSYYGYKGGIASLLLAVCDSDMRLTYVNTGAPAGVRHAGLYGRSNLHARIHGGMLKQCRVPLKFRNGPQKDIFSNLVGDAAFPLSQHMMKVFEPPPAAGTAQARCNRRLLNARRLTEQAFGTLKGKFVFCSKNSFWNDFKFTKQAIQACCGLHNFLEERRVDAPVAHAGVDDALQPIPKAGMDPGGGCRSQRHFGAMGCRELNPRVQYLSCPVIRNHTLPTLPA
jgi:hypothetical protein